MPTWGEILKELAESQKTHGTPQLDQVRRKYIVLLQQETGRAVILYSSKWTQPDANIPPGLVSIVDEDLQGLMEVIHAVKENKLDLILHSPGGSLEAAEALVLYPNDQIGADLEVQVWAGAPGRSRADYSNLLPTTDSRACRSPIVDACRIKMSIH